MKKVILIPIIIGGALLVTGGIILGVGLANSSIATETHEFELTDDFTNLEFDLDISDLTFVKSSSGTKKLIFQEAKKQYHNYTVNEGTLKVNYVDSRIWSEKMFSFNKIQVTVYLPEDTYGSLKIKDHTGDMVIPNDFTFDSFYLTGDTGNLNMDAKVTNSFYTKLSTGDITLNGVTAKSMELKTSTGKMTLKDVEVSEDILMNISTGNINLTNVKAKNLSKNPESGGSTGNVKLTNTIIAEKLFIKCGTGDVRFDASDAHDIEVETSTGDIKGTILTGKLFTAKSSTGHVDVPEDDPAGGKCILKSSTGDIKITLA